MLTPRSTGIEYCVNTLGTTLDAIYDVTIGFEGVSGADITERHVYPEDIYTLRDIYFGGRKPPRVHLHLRRFPVDAIPTDTPDNFRQWIRTVFEEKDDLMTHFYQHGCFPSSSTPDVVTLNIGARLQAQ